MTLPTARIMTCKEFIAECERIGKAAQAEIAAATTLEELEQVRIKYLGRKAGLLTLLGKELGQLPSG